MVFSDEDSYDEEDEFESDLDTDGEDEFAGIADGWDTDDLIDTDDEEGLGYFLPQHVEEALGEDALAAEAYLESGSEDGSACCIEDPSHQEERALQGLLPPLPPTRFEVGDMYTGRGVTLERTNHMPRKGFGGPGTDASNVSCFFKPGCRPFEVRARVRPDSKEGKAAAGAEAAVYDTVPIARLARRLGAYLRSRGQILSKVAHHQAADAINVTVVGQGPEGPREQLTVVHGSWIRVYDMGQAPEADKDRKTSEASTSQAARPERISRTINLPDGSKKEVLLAAGDDNPPLDPWFVQPLGELNLGDLEPYSVTRSSDGAVIAVCGDDGELAMLQCTGAAAGLPGPGGLVVLAKMTLGRADAYHDPAAGEGPAVAAVAPQNNSTMCNSVRFGRIFGRERLLVGVQLSSRSGYVAILDVPDFSDPDPLARAAAAACPIHTRAHLEATGRVFRGDRVRPPLNPHKGSEGALRLRAAGAPEDAPPIHTAAIGPLPFAVNCAVASPSGSHVAVVGDSMDMLLLTERSGFAPLAARKITLPANRPRAPRVRHPGGSGLQYACWSSDGRLVIASSDQSLCAFIADVESGTCFGRIASDKAFLPVAACPWDPRLAFVAESSSHITAFDCLPVRPSAEKFAAVARGFLREAGVRDAQASTSQGPAPHPRDTGARAAAAGAATGPASAAVSDLPPYRRGEERPAAAAARAVADEAERCKKEAQELDAAIQEALAEREKAVEAIKALSVGGKKGAKARSSNMYAAAMAESQHLDQLRKLEAAKQNKLSAVPDKLFSMALKAYELQHGPVARWMQRVRVPRPERVPDSVVAEPAPTAIPNALPGVASWQLPLASRTITGIAVAPQSRMLIVSTRQRLLAYPLIAPAAGDGGWTQDLHKHLPAPFRRSIQELLLCAKGGAFQCHAAAVEPSGAARMDSGGDKAWPASRTESPSLPAPGDSDAPAGISDLPEALLEAVIVGAAGPVTKWRTQYM